MDNSEDECLSTQFECKHDTRVFHCHSLKEKHQGKTQARRKSLITCAVCLIFMIGEVTGGYAAHSLAIMTDAAHLLTDFGSISTSLFSLWISSRTPSKCLTFGWHRSVFCHLFRPEILGALLSVLSIWTVTVVLVLFAVQRIISDDYEIHSDVMMITAACAVVLNIFLAFILHQSPVRHSHSHGLTEEHRNTSVRAAFIHVLGDLLQSLDVLLAATIIYFWTSSEYSWKESRVVKDSRLSSLRMRNPALRPRGHHRRANQPTDCADGHEQTTPDTIWIQQYHHSDRDS